MTATDFNPRNISAGNLRAAHRAGKKGWPSPEQVDRWNSGYVHSEKEQEYWEIGREFRTE